MTDEPVTYSVEEGTATITLNRPEKRNALTPEISVALIDVVEELEELDPRCVVVRGAGGAFSAGGDVDAMRSRIEDGVALHDRVDFIDRTTGRAIARIAQFPAPTVAAVDGPAFGAGATLAIACDVVLASDEARIGFGFRQVGLAVDAGTSYLLPRIVGENVAKELAFTGELVAAERAREIGLFNHVYPADEFEERAGDLVETIAGGPTVALRQSKRLLGQGLDSSLDEASANESAAQAAVFATRDHEEGVEAFFDRRAPEFEGR